MKTKETQHSQAHQAGSGPASRSNPESTGGTGVHGSGRDISKSIEALASATTPEERAAAKALLLVGYDALIKGSAEHIVDTVRYQHERAQLSDEQYQAEVNQALDTINDPGGHVPSTALLRVGTLSTELMTKLSGSDNITQSTLTTNKTIMAKRVEYQELIDLDGYRKAVGEARAEYAEFITDATRLNAALKQSMAGVEAELLKIKNGSTSIGGNDRAQLDYIQRLNTIVPALQRQRAASAALTAQEQQLEKVTGSLITRQEELLTQLGDIQGSTGRDIYSFASVSPVS